MFFFYIYVVLKVLVVNRYWIIFEIALYKHYIIINIIFLANLIKTNLDTNIEIQTTIEMKNGNDVCERTILIFKS